MRGLMVASLASVLCSTITVASARSPLGFGNTRCEHVLALLNERVGREATFFGWAQGWMAGLNLREVQADREPTDLYPNSYPIERQKQFLFAYCRNNPRDDFWMAAAGLYVTMRTEQGLSSVGPRKKS